MLSGADPGFFAVGTFGGGGGSTTAVYSGADGGSRVDKHQIKVHSVHRIFRANSDFLFFPIVKKFVEKKLVVESRGGGVTIPPPPPPPGSAPGFGFLNAV